MTEVGKFFFCYCEVLSCSGANLTTTSMITREDKYSLGTIESKLITSVFERVDLFRPMKRSTHFKHNDPCSCAYLNYLFGFMGNPCTSSMTEEIDGISAGENLFT